MTLVPLEHPTRIRSAHAAAMLFERLGCPRVSLRGLHTRDASRIAQLVDAIEPAHEHTVSFEDGSLGPEAMRALSALTLGRFAYLDVRTEAGGLRVWPELRAWVQPAREPRTFETTDRSAALDAFQALSPQRLERGFLNGARAETKPLLLAFLSALGAQVHVVLDVSVSTARALTQLYGDDPPRAGVTADWQASGVLVDFPSGRVHGYLTSSTDGPKARAAWMTRIDRALHGIA